MITNSAYSSNGGNGGYGGGGGGAFNFGSSAFYSCTIISNVCGAGGQGGQGRNLGINGTGGIGGGVNNGGTGAQILNTIIAGNGAPATGPDVVGNFTSLGFNLIGDTSGSSGFGTSGDLLGVNALLGPLADNSGYTLTCALQSGSPAMDAGTSVGTPSTDQRGIIRPQGAAVDIGALESVVTNAFITVTPASLNFGSIQTGTTADRNFYLTNTGSAMLTGEVTVMAPFSMVAESSYNLGANQGKAVTVRYMPSLAGSNSQSVFFTGGAGASRMVTGTAFTPPQLTGEALSNGLFRFVLNGPICANYVIQVSSNLFNWSAISTNTIPAGGLVSLMGSDRASEPRLFYRAIPFAGTAAVAGAVVAWGENNVGQTNVPAVLTNSVGIGAGIYHGLALQPDGTVVGWGENDFGQANPPVGLSNVVAVAGGWGTSLALKCDGTLEAWGWGETNYSLGMATTAHSLTSITKISANWDCLMALKADGTVLVWGLSTHGETTVPSGLANVVAIAGGGFHCLALKADGTVVAWGSYGAGQTNVPAGLNSVTAIAAGGGHSLALKADGTVAA